MWELVDNLQIFIGRTGSKIFYIFYIFYIFHTNEFQIANLWCFSWCCLLDDIGHGYKKSRMQKQKGVPDSLDWKVSVR